MTIYPVSPNSSVNSDKPRPKGLGISSVNIGGKFQIQKKSYKEAPLSAILSLYLCNGIFVCTAVSISCIVSCVFCPHLYVIYTGELSTAVRLLSQTTRYVVWTDDLTVQVARIYTQKDHQAIFRSPSAQVRPTWMIPLSLKFG